MSLSLFKTFQNWIKYHLKIQLKKKRKREKEKDNSHTAYLFKWERKRPIIYAADAA